MGFGGWDSKGRFGCGVANGAGVEIDYVATFYGSQGIVSNGKMEN